MLRAGDGVVVGVSGGPDSLCLLDVLWRLQGALGLRLHVAHLHHGLRGAGADEDALFVAAEAAARRLPVTVGSVRLAEGGGSSVSLEAAAREARYHFLHRVADAVGASRIAVGHTRDDQAETVLIRLLRGAGPPGLAGIAPVRADGVVRPLLEVGRQEAERYCRERGLTPRRDPTNEDLSITRNRVRHLLLPFLRREFNPSVDRALVALAGLAREDEAWWAEVTERALSRVIRPAEDSGGWELDTARLRMLVLPLRRRVLRELWRRIGGSPPPRSRVAAALSALDHRSGSVQLARGWRLDVSGDRALLWRPLQTTGDDTEAALDYDLRLDVPGAVVVPAAGLRLEAWLEPAERGWERVRHGCPPWLAVLDAACLELPLVIRSRRPGDRFTPLGAPGSMRLKKFLVEAGIPRWQRRRLPVVVSGAELVWVVGVRQGEPCRLQPGSRTAAVLRAMPVGHEQAFEGGGPRVVPACGRVLESIEFTSRLEEGDDEPE